MAKFPLVGPTYQSQSPNLDAEMTMNWYPEICEVPEGNSKIALYPTPGLKTFVSLAVQLGIAKSHSGNFTQGQTGATFQAVVTNTGTIATQGTVTVVETPPAGLTFVSMTGTGWTVVGNQATRSDSLAPGASYPPLTITVNVAVDANSPQVNQVCVSGGGMLQTVCTSDSTIISPSTPNPLLVDTPIHLCLEQGYIDHTWSVPAGGYKAGDTGVMVFQGSITNNVGPAPIPGTITDFEGNVWGLAAGPVYFTNPVGAQTEYISLTVYTMRLASDIAAGTSYRFKMVPNPNSLSNAGEVTLNIYRGIGNLIGSTNTLSTAGSSTISPAITTTQPAVILASLAWITTPYPTGWTLQGVDQFAAQIAMGAPAYQPAGTFNPTFTIPTFSSPSTVDGAIMMAFSV